MKSLLKLLTGLFRKEEKDNGSDRISFFFLDEGNQDKLIVASSKSMDWVEEIKSKYDWDNFDQYDNRMWEYMYKLFDEPVQQYGEKNPESTSHDLWKELTRAQKVFWAFLAFNGDTDNGGVYQFFFNRPEFAFAVSEIWEELDMKQLQEDYQSVLKELFGKKLNLGERRMAFNDESVDWDKRWKAFSDGYKELKSTEKIEDYYYSKEFKKELYKRVADYIEDHIEGFIKS